MAESTSLYRRHRPLSFDEVVGQEHVVRTLRNAVEGDRVHHAYLFVGSRGTGKTSMAKILARSLNCVDGPTANPCGECESCRTIAAGTSLDVIEMDAASNRSVDDIRELRERVGFVPAAGRWKVYILDEAHMLTKEAWNAFLKTLEEPPPHTIFILATTEPQKVMATIVDRCQRFDFQRPSLEQIAEVVRRVAAAEGIAVDEGAVALIARSATGSFRDALGTLDQLAAAVDGGVRTEDVLDLLGAADADLIFDATDAIAGGDGAAVLEVVERLARSGRDPGQFARDLIAHLRQLLVTRVSGEPPQSFSVTVSDPERVGAQAGAIGEATLVGAIDALSAAVAAMREGDDPRMTLEVALLKVAHPALDPSREAMLRRLERLERGGVAAEPAPSVAGASDRIGEATEPPTDSDEAPAARRLERSGSSEPGPADAGQGAEGSAVVATEDSRVVTSEDSDGGSVTIELEHVTRLWPAVVEHVRDSAGGKMLSTLFEGARPLAIDSERAAIRVGFPAGAAFNKRKAEAKSNVERIADAVHEVVGERLHPIYELLDHDPEPPAANGAPELGDEELVDLIKTNFDAEEIEEAEG